MFSKKVIAAILAAGVILAFCGVQAQQNNLVHTLAVVVTDLGRVIGGLGTILANPGALLNGQLGGNVGELVDRIVALVADLLKNVTELLYVLGLAN